MGVAVIHRSGSNARQGKVLYFEWLRCLGAAAVVMIHVTSGIMDNYPISEVGTARALIWSLMQVALLRRAVPVFFMITGALLLDPSKEIGWSKVWGYVRRMAIVLFTWGFLFCIMQRLFTERALTLSLLTGSLLDLLSNKGFSHLWYIYALIGAYLLLPMLRTWVASADESDQRVMLAILFVFTCVVPTLNAAFGLELSTFVWVTSSVFYVLLGYYAHGRLELNGRMLAVGFGSLLVCMLLKTYGIVAVGEYWKWLHGPACPFEAIWSLCVFLLAKRWFDRQYAERGIVARGADLSFGVYVLHPLFINVLYKVLNWMPWRLPPMVFEATIWSISCMGSVVLIYIARRIPLVRTIL